MYCPHAKLVEVRLVVEKMLFWPHGSAIGIRTFKLEARARPLSSPLGWDETCETVTMKPPGRSVPVFVIPCPVFGPSVIVRLLSRFALPLCTWVEVGFRPYAPQ